MNRLLSHLGPPLRAVRAVVRNRSIRRMQLAFILFNVAEPAMWIGVLLFAFDRGGTRAVGLVTIVCLVPSGILAPVAASLGDRFPRTRVVRGGYAAQAVTTAVLAVAIGANAPTEAVYALSLIASLPYTTGRPNHHALMPSLATTPEQVAASNSVSALVEGIGYIVGGLIAAALATIGPGAIVAVAAAALVLAVVVTLGVHGGTRGSEGGLHPWSLATDAVHGLAVLVRSAGPRVLMILYAALALTTGAVGVLFVPLAIDRLGLGDPGVGLLSTSQSVGLFLGAGISIGFATRRRLAFAMLAAAAGYAAGASLLGVAVTTVVAVCGAAVYGAGVTLTDVLARTLLQRITDDELLTRVFGTVEGLWLLGFAVGAAAAAPLEAAVGLGPAFVAIGGIFLATAALVLPGLRRIDAAAVIPERQLALLGQVPFFAPLPRVDLERLARQLVRAETPTGTEVIRQGDLGDRFYLVDAGTFAIDVDGRRIDTTTEGGFFGEIALLHDVPRTATVRALEDGAVWTLDREEFLATVTGLPQSHAAARAVSAERLRNLDSD
ncbi:MAG: cyclic nucleotide-binding domain-containing protein [Actinomycetota bacterium]